MGVKDSVVGPNKLGDVLSLIPHNAAQDGLRATVISFVSWTQSYSDFLCSPDYHCATVVYFLFMFYQQVYWCGQCGLLTIITQQAQM